MSPSALTCRVAALLTLCLAVATPAQASSGFSFHQPLGTLRAPDPGVRAAAPTQQALDTTLEQLTGGLSASEVTVKSECTAPAPGQVGCYAKSLVRRDGHQRIHPHVAARKTFTQVFPSRHQGIAPAAGAGSPAAAAPTAGTPAWLQQAYDLTYLSQTGGVGDTIGIVDAYDDPTAEADLATYRTRYGLPPCTTANGCFRKMNQNGSTLATDMPPANSGWAMEIALDLDAVSALCPNCKIVLVEANSAYSNDLAAAISRAVLSGAKQVSNSYGGVQYSPDWYFNPTYPGVALLASTGDSGTIPAGMAAYPAAWPGITAVGGTTLALTGGSPSARGFGETAWSGSGSGCNTQSSIAKPSYQTDSGCSGRSYADVSADADPNTGLVAYGTSSGGWFLVGGTSLSSPLAAAYLAVTGIDGSSPRWAYTASALLNDPASGNNGSCSISYICNAVTGYDGPTGIGSISGAVVTGAPGVSAPARSSGYLGSASATTAVLSGGIYPNSLDTTYFWQYGTTTSYDGQTATTGIGAGNAPVLTSSTLTGLAAGTTYHYRMVAQNSAGTSYGYDYTFTTAAAGSTPPGNTGAPLISGTAQQGQTLTTSPGTWSPAATSYAYQWQRSTDGGINWSVISGQTATTYVPGVADLGAKLRVTVTASNAYGPGVATSAPVGPVASGAPVNTTAPSISGTVRQGAVLTAANGSWSPAGATYAYAWQRSSDDGATWAAISGATDSTYIPVAADVGAKLRVTVTATNPYGAVGASAALVGPVASGAPLNTSPPAISGAPRRGQVLTVASTWNPAGASYAYQWQRSTDGTTWTAIGSNAASYTPVGADQGALVRVTVTATNPFGQVPATSPSVGPIGTDPPVNTTPPTVTGTTQRTYALTASRGSWDGSGNTYTYQWQRSDGSAWAPIAGATNAAYTLGPDDEGDWIRVLVTAINPDGVVGQTSNATPQLVAPYPPANTVAPSITGTPQRTSVLTASRGTWTGPDNVYAYQWQRDFGEGYVDIPGATGTTYTLTFADEFATVRVVVRATNPDATIVEASQPTTLVQDAGPFNQSPPVLTGVAQRGSILMASLGSWSGLGNTYAYQWQASLDGNAWTKITGATGSTYTLGVSDEGTQVRALVTATNADGSASAASAASAKVPSAPPVNTVKPAITGTAQRAATLTSTAGTWNGIGNVFAYQWQRDSGSGFMNIAGATAPSYTLTVADEWASVRMLVTVTNPDGSASAASDPTSSVTSAPPVNTTAPAVTGTAQRGSVLTSTQGLWNGQGNSYAYQWQGSTDGSTWTKITGATGSSYTLGVSDEGTQVRALVTATNADGSVSAASAASATIPSAPPVNTVKPVVTGTAQRASTLAATQGTWDGLGNSYSYQWQRDPGSGFANIANATSNTYTLTVADEFTKVRVLVTAANADATVSAASNVSATVASAPPVNTAAPIVTGTAQRSSTLTATWGAWSGIGNVYVYQWQRDSGAGFVNIAAATGSSYTLTVADENAKVRVLITATNPDGSDSAASAATATVAAAPPVNTTKPVITGTAQRASTLIATAGSWSGIGNSYAYQWQRSADQGGVWQNINGATSATYTLVLADVGTIVRIVVTTTNPDGSASQASTATSTIAGQGPVNVVQPTVAGNAQRASTLTSTPGTWTGIANSYTYQWQSSTDGTTWTAIRGATDTSYTLTASEEGATVRVLVTASNADGSTSQASNATVAVRTAPPVNSAPPAVTGTAQRTFTLSATQGTWDGPGNTYAYQWQHDSGTGFTNITDATGASYVLGRSDEGTKLRVLVTATNPDTSVSVASAATATVTAAPPAVTAAPTVTGTPQRTLTLTAVRGTWTGPDNTYAYQWQRDAGAGFAAIAGATGTTYTLGSADVGAKLRVQVVATNPDAGVSATSAATATVQAAPPVNTSPPTIAGTAGLDGRLTAAPGAWTPSGAGYSYTWQRTVAGNPSSFQDIAGATGSTYTLQRADVGAAVRVKVTATNVDGATSATSAATAPVTAPPTNTLLPAAPLGTARQGSLLTADHGTWDAPDATFSYTWLRCATGATSISSGCADLGTGATYTLTAADIGHPIGVHVTATTGGGSTAADSALTAAVTQLLLVNSVLPSISGTPQVPHTLTADPGQWSLPLTSVTYAWQRCAADGVSSCRPVGDGSGQYTLSAADDGDTIVLYATVTAGSQTASAHSPALSIQQQPVPQNTVAPAVTGTPARGSTLTAGNGVWTNSPTQFSYQWRRCPSGQSCQDIAGATAATYVAAQADEDAALTVVVTAANAVASGTATADPTSPIAAAPPVNTQRPAIQSSGPVAQGVTLTVTGVAWQATPDTSFGISWERCDAGGCQPIAGATDTQYTLLAADVGHTFVAVSSAANVDGSASARSAQTAVALPSPPRWKTLPTLSSSAGHVDDVLNITAGVWTGPVVTTDTTQMMRCTNVCTARGPSNLDTYTIAAADLGAILRVRETASNAGGDTVVWSSRYVGPVISAQAAAGVVTQRQTALRNSKGTTLALAQMPNTAKASGAKAPPQRTVALKRAPSVAGKLVAWACPTTVGTGAVPAPCSAKVTLRKSATLRLPASASGQVRVVVIKPGK